MEETTMTYLCRFDDNGRRGETRLACEYTDEQKEAMIADGFVEISEADWEYYVGNHGMGDNGTGYIRGKDGKPTSAPAHVPTKEERLAVLDSQYDSDKAQLREYLTDALLADDSDLMGEIRQEMADIDSQYEAERQAILDE